MANQSPQPAQQLAATEAGQYCLSMVATAYRQHIGGALGHSKLAQSLAGDIATNVDRVAALTAEVNRLNEANRELEARRRDHEHAAGIERDRAHGYGVILKSFGHELPPLSDPNPEHQPDKAEHTEDPARHPEGNVARLPAPSPAAA